MTEDKNVIVGEDLTAEGKRKLHTDDIAGAAKAHSEEFKKAERGNGNRPNADLEPLFAGDVERDFRTRWRDIQSAFVDEPRSAVEKADQLVAELMQRLAQSFSEQRKDLEKQWEALCETRKRAEPRSMIRVGRHFSGSYCKLSRIRLEMPLAIGRRISSPT